MPTIDLSSPVSLTSADEMTILKKAAAVDAVVGSMPTPVRVAQAEGGEFFVPPVTSAEQLKELLPRQLQVYLLQRAAEIIAASDGQMVATTLNKKVATTLGKENAPAVKAAVGRAGGWHQMVAARPNLFEWAGTPPTVVLKSGVSAEDAVAKLCDPTFVDNVALASPKRRNRTERASKGDKQAAPRASQPAADANSPRRRSKSVLDDALAPSFGGRRKSVQSPEGAPAARRRSTTKDILTELSVPTTPEVLGPDPNPAYRRKVMVSPIALCRQPRGPDGPKGFSSEYQTTRLASRLALERAILVQ